ncbi:MAG TPA: MarR family transcriptional regulator [Patescibacteria group bacterium]|nr:MarR family transcriptional regulator [Patescibacteria group bacterium]
MKKITKKDLEQQVILTAREYGINTVLYRHAVGAMLGVNVTDMECLGALFFKGLATPTELSLYTGLSSGATTAMLDRLEKSGLIERRPNPKDRRGSVITVAKDAKTKVGPLFMPVRIAQDALVASYSREELELIAGFLQQASAIWETERKKLSTS